MFNSNYTLVTGGALLPDYLFPFFPNPTHLMWFFVFIRYIRTLQIFYFKLWKAANCYDPLLNCEFKYISDHHPLLYHFYRPPFYLVPPNTYVSNFNTLQFILMYALSIWLQVWYPQICLLLKYIISGMCTKFPALCGNQ